MYNSTEFKFFVTIDTIIFEDFEFEVEITAQINEPETHSFTFEIEKINDCTVIELIKDGVFGGLELEKRLREKIKEQYQDLIWADLLEELKDKY